MKAINAGALLVPILVTVICGSAVAARTAVLPVHYIVEPPGGEAAELADKFRRVAVDSAEKSGWETYSTEEIDTTYALHIGADGLETCRERKCLRKLAAHLDAENALFISVLDRNNQEFQVELHFSDRAPITAQKKGPVAVVLQWVQGHLEYHYGESADKPVNLILTEFDAAPPADHRPLKPTAFWTALAITGTAVVTFGALELTVWQRVKTLEDGGQNDSYWKTTNRLQVAEMVALGVAATGLATTGILFFITDFSKPAAPKGSAAESIRVRPIFDANTGLLMVTGRF